MAGSGSTRDDDAVGRLYQLRPDAFVGARDAMAKDLRAAGDRSGADAIKALRKPPITAWALNRLAAGEPEALEALFAANDRLRAAMAGSGKDTRERYRAASEERQRIVTGLVDRARAILEEADLPAGRANLDRIASTLMATATDDAGADLIRSGLLDHDLSPGGGFGEVFGGAPPDTAAGTSRPADQPDPKREAAERRRMERAERDANTRAEQAKEADRLASDAERTAEEAEREAERVTRIATARRRDADRARREADHAADLARTALERLDATDPEGQ